MHKNKTYTNDDLAAIPLANRTWGPWNFSALWISMSICVPTYMLASSLIDGGMNAWQALLTIFVGNAIILVPILLNGNAGAKYGIPFPVFCRVSFGIRGANIPSLLRAIVACGWFGIQTWLGGSALYAIVRIWIPGVENLPEIFPSELGLKTGPALGFFSFWWINMIVVRYGIEGISKLIKFKSFALPIITLLLLSWGYTVAHGFGPIFSRPSKFSQWDDFLGFFFPALTGVIGNWATISLNIPDFTRYAISSKAQRLGQALTLPTVSTLFSFVGIAVTSASALVFGSTLWNPIELAEKFQSPLLVSFSMLCIALSTLATNITANIVSPANDISNLFPSRISFRQGGYITGVIGIFTCPWKLVADPTGFIFTWLIAYSSLLGPIAGIMIADYYWIRKQKICVEELYRSDGQYWFTQGFNGRAIAALGLGILPNIPGFLTTTGAVSPHFFPSYLNHLYHYAWFIGFFLSGLLHIALSTSFTSHTTLQATAESLHPSFED